MLCRTKRTARLRSACTRVRMDSMFLSQRGPADPADVGVNHRANCLTVRVHVHLKVGQAVRRLALRPAIRAPAPTSQLE